MKCQALGMSLRGVPKGRRSNLKSRSLRPALAGLAMTAAVLLLDACGLTLDAAYAQKNLKVVDFSYEQHFNPGDSIIFNVRVKNNESTAQGAELLILLTSNATGTLTAADVGSGAGAVSAGGTFTFTVTLANFTLAQPAGVYTVLFRLLDGDGIRTDQVRGKFPIHIGSDRKLLAVFPEVLNLGVIPAGRYMHPIPLEVDWSFFDFNKLRLDQSFVIRIYTDNSARHQGVPGALRRGSPGGLVSLDGKYTIPLKVWCLNFGPDIQETGWDSSLSGPPPVDDDSAWLGPPLLEGGRNHDAVAWVRVKDRSEMAASPFGWSRGEGVIGQDPHDVRYATDKNPTGEFTLTSPFTVYLATEAGPTAVEGIYQASLIVELWSP